MKLAGVTAIVTGGAPAHFECEAALDDFVADSEQWVAIITGAGDQAF